MPDVVSNPRRHFAAAVAAGGSALLLPRVAAADATALPPPAMGDLNSSVLQVLTRFSELISRHDLTLASEFAEDAVLVGSEEGEVTVGRSALTALLQRAFAKPHTVSWEWEQPVAHRVGDLAWFFVEATVVVVTDGTAQRMPYRVSGMLEWRASRWVWRQYHGAEPAHP
jgi:hypothetical protein